MCWSTCGSGIKPQSSSPARDAPAWKWKARAAATTGGTPTPARGRAAWPGPAARRPPRRQRDHGAVGRRRRRDLSAQLRLAFQHFQAPQRVSAVGPTSGRCRRRPCPVMIPPGPTPADRHRQRFGLLHPVGDPGQQPQSCPCRSTLGRPWSPVTADNRLRPRPSWQPSSSKMSPPPGSRSYSYRSIPGQEGFPV